MNRLFVKIFLWFWLAMALVWSVFLLPDVLGHNEEVVDRFRALTEQRLLLSGWTALRIHYRGGEEGLAEFIKEMEQEEGTPYPFVLTAEMRELAGRELPPEAAETARTAFAEGTARITFPERGVYAGRSFETRSGNRYAVVQRMPSRLDLPPAGPWHVAGRWLSVLVASGLVCYGLARYLLAPVTMLSRATRLIAEGELGTRVGDRIGKRGDELSALGRDFDVMAERIGLLLQRQRELLSDISHELRSPLARLYVALGLARRHADSSGQEALDRIERETERLNDLIGELLSLTRLEEDQASRVQEPVDLHALVRQIVEDADYEARGSSRTVRLVRSEPIVTRGFEELLRRAVENVVRNAVRHTPEGTGVEVALDVVRENAAPEAVIHVRDHGSGVPEAQIERLFEPFYRIGQARDRGRGGVGLGLSISQRAVRLHSGRIAARNAEDGGLLVEIRLPAPDAGTAAPHA